MIGLDKIQFIEGLISLGGLSECGKSSAGELLEKHGFLRQKIILIEREIMQEKGIDVSKGMTDEMFILLYKDNPDDVFEQFLSILIDKMIDKGTNYASIESLYRPELGLYLKKVLGEKFCNVYIDAPFDVRTMRELERRRQEGDSATIEQIQNATRKKDKFKTDHYAHQIKNTADVIVNNSAHMSKKDFEEAILHIATSLKNGR